MALKFWLRWNRVAGLDDYTRYGFIGYEGATAIDIAALVVTFFGGIGQILTGTGVGYAAA